MKALREQKKQIFSSSCEFFESIFLQEMNNQWTLLTLSNMYIFIFKSVYNKLYYYFINKSFSFIHLSFYVSWTLGQESLFLLPFPYPRLSSIKYVFFYKVFLFF